MTFSIPLFLMSSPLCTRTNILLGLIAKYPNPIHRAYLETSSSRREQTERRRGLSRSCTQNKPLRPLTVGAFAAKANFGYLSAWYDCVLTRIAVEFDFGLRGGGGRMFESLCH